MADASSTLSVYNYPDGVDNTQRHFIAYGTCILAPSGTYPTGGIPLGWNRMISADGRTFIPQVGPSSINPKAGKAQFYTLGNETTIPDYNYVYSVPSTGSTVLRILSAGTELTGGAAITADNIGFKAEWERLEY